MKRFKPLLELVKNYKDYNFMILGGAPSALYNNSYIYSDIDFFFRTEDDMNKLLYKLKENYVVQHKTDNAITLQPLYYTIDETIQLIVKQYGSYKEHFRTFDINKAKIGIELKDSKASFIIDDDYKKDIYVCRTHQETFNRLIKYQGKGYNLKYENIKDTIFNLLSNKSIITFEKYYGEHKTEFTKYKLIGDFLFRVNSNFTKEFLNDLTFFNKELIHGCRHTCSGHFWVYVYNLVNNIPISKNSNYDKIIRQKYPEVLIQL